MNSLLKYLCDSNFLSGSVLLGLSPPVSPPPLCDSRCVMMEPLSPWALVPPSCSALTHSGEGSWCVFVFMFHIWMVAKQYNCYNWIFKPGPNMRPRPRVMNLLFHLENVLRPLASLSISIWGDNNCERLVLPNSGLLNAITDSLQDRMGPL